MRDVIEVLFTIIICAPLAYGTFINLFYIAYPEDEELFKKNRENDK